MMKKRVAGMSVLVAMVTFTAWTSAALVNVAPDATYSYLTVWPGTPGIWGDSGTQLNDGNLTNIVIESNGEPVVAVFDLGQDMPIAQLAIFARETDWGNNHLSGTAFYTSTEASGEFTRYFSEAGHVSLAQAGWSTYIDSIDKSTAVWSVTTEQFSTPLTARYVAVVTSSALYAPVAISEVAIYVPEPVTLVLLAVGGVAGLRRRM